MSAKSDWMDAVSMHSVQMWEADTDASVLAIISARDYHVDLS